MITCTIQEIQPTKHSITLIWTFRDNPRSPERPYKDLLYVLHVNFGHNMHHSEDTAH